MHYFDVFECDYCEDIKNLINTCAECRHSTANDNYSTKSACSCNSSLTLLDANQCEKNSVSINKIQKNQSDQTKMKPYSCWLPIDLRMLLNVNTPLLLQSLRLTSNLLF